MAGKIGVHPTTAYRLLNDLSIQVNGHSLLLSDLVTPYPQKLSLMKTMLDMARDFGTFDGFFQQYSDEDIRKKLQENGIKVARRTICKYKNELLQSNLVKPRVCSEHLTPEQHWYLDRLLNEEDLEEVVIGKISPFDIRCLETPTEHWGTAQLEKTATGYNLTNLRDLPAANLYFFYMHRKDMFPTEGVTALAVEIEKRAIQAETGHYSIEHLEAIDFKRLNDIPSDRV